MSEENLNVNETVLMERNSLLSLIKIKTLSWPKLDHLDKNIVTIVILEIIASANNDLPTHPKWREHLLIIPTVIVMTVIVTVNEETTHRPLAITTENAIITNLTTITTHHLTKLLIVAKQAPTHLPHPSHHLNTPILIRTLTRIHTHNHHNHHLTLPGDTEHQTIAHPPTTTAHTHLATKAALTMLHAITHQPATQAHLDTVIMKKVNYQEQYQQKRNYHPKRKKRKLEKNWRRNWIFGVMFMKCLGVRRS